MDSKAVVKPAIVLLLISAIAAGILGVVSEVPLLLLLHRTKNL